MKAKRGPQAVPGLTRSMSIQERFWAYVDRSSDGCWAWLGGVTGKGRAKYRDGRSAARWAWEFAMGPIPDGLVVCHSCDNKLCVNPAHLWVGTVGDNNRDMFAKGRGRPGRRCLT